MQGAIDQESGVLEFTEGESLVCGYAGSLWSITTRRITEAGLVEAWNAQLERVCTAINAASRKIITQHPALAPQ